MKYTITSDIHDKFKNAQVAFQYSIDNGINTVIDAGDLERVKSVKKAVEDGILEGITLHSVLTERSDYRSDDKINSNGLELTEVLESGNGVMHKKGEQFTLDNLLAIHLEHEVDPKDEYNNKISNCKDISEIQEGIERLASEELTPIVIFGHSHNPHYEIRGKTLFLNPGSLGSRSGSTFAVYDSEEKTVEYHDGETGDLIFKLGGDSEVVGFRDFFDNERVEVLANGNERYNTGEFTSEEYAKIISGRVNEDNLYLVVEHEDGTQQILWPEFESDAYFGEIRNIKESKKDSAIPSSFVVKVENRDILVLVDDSLEELMSIEYDNIESYPSRIVREDTLQTYLINKTEDTEEIWFNDQKVASYDSVSSLDDHEDFVLARAKKGDKERVVVIDNKGNVIEGNHYDSISKLDVVNGKILYNVKDNDLIFPVVDGEELVKTPSASWKDEIKSQEFVGDKLAYVVESEEILTLYHGTEMIDSIKKASWKSNMDSQLTVLKRKYQTD